MKTFIFNSKKNWKIEVDIDEEPQIKENYSDDYSKELKIINLKVDEIEVPKNKLNNLFLVKFQKNFDENKKEVLVIDISYEAFKFIKKLKKINTKMDSGKIICSQELSDYYHKIFLPNAEKVIEELKAEKLKKIEEEFKKLTDESIVEISEHSNYGYSVFGSYSDHDFFKKLMVIFKKTPLKFDKKYLVNTDMGDYSITEYYKIPFKELNKLYDEGLIILDEIKEKKERKRIEIDREKKSLNMQIIEEGDEGKRYDSDIFAKVKIIDPQSNESLEFNCRNIFDFGYVVNPNYLIGDEYGGIATNGYWEQFKENGWTKIRELTKFEEKCVEYLHKFPPIRTDIRL